MVLTDPISDMLTRIRNAKDARFEQVSFPASKVKLEILKILKSEKFIKDYQLLRDGKKSTLRVQLWYGQNKEEIILGIKRISKPGCRIYVKAKDVPKVRGGLGIAILSTPFGILSDKEAKKKNTGGEVICYVW